MYSISQLFIYPIKSLGGIQVATAQLTDRGLQYDRRWMLVDANLRFLTQREFPEMSQLQAVIENDRLVIFHKNAPADKLTQPLNPSPATIVSVKVWDDECKAQFISDEANEWFSSKLSKSCKLVYMPENEKRKVDESYAHNSEITAFSDGYPLMIIGQASLDDLNSRLVQPLPVNRFRPNIVFTGGLPFAEDTMEHIIVNGIDMYGVKLCARCVVTTIDQTTSIKSIEPLKTLTGYRMANNKIYFGQNVLFKQTGLLKVGNEIEIVSSKLPMEFNKKDNQLK